VPLEQRIQNLVEDYTGISNEKLEAAFHRIQSKLGGQHLKTAIEALHQGDPAAAAAVALRYYDKTYQYGLENNSATEIRMLKFDDSDPTKIAQACRQTADQ
jgi:tRNA 2-selenouridine synthase